MRPQDQQSRVLYELSSMVIHILKSPPISIPFTVGTMSSSSSSPSSSSSSRQASTAFSSPTAFASLFLGISVAMMLFGSVTFVIGFMLMPLIMALVLLFYAVEFLFNLSEFGRSIIFPSSYQRDVPSFRFREYDAHG